MSQRKTKTKQPGTKSTNQAQPKKHGSAAQLSKCTTNQKETTNHHGGLFLLPKIIIRGKDTGKTQIPSRAQVEQ